MLIAVAGPYSAPTAQARQANLDAMNRAAAAVLARGHAPVIGVNCALPVVEQARLTEDRARYDAIMTISLGVVGRCDAILMIGSSPGADKERDLLASQGKPVYHALSEIPTA